MTDAALVAGEPASSKKRKLLPIAAALLLAGGGFASTYLGLWSPAQVIRTQADRQSNASDVPVVFVNVPAIELSMPGGRGRMLSLSANIETDTKHQKDIAHLMPRVVDAFTVFLSEIDPAAYDKRGVLEIIRAELLTRARLVLGDEAVKELLITEFRIK